MSQPDERIGFVSYLQTIGIILVVVGHSFHEYPIDHGHSLLAYRLIYSFHMPLFVFISGYLLAYSTFIRDKRKRIKEFIVEKSRRLLVPYFVLGAITFIPRALMSGMADSTIELSWGSFAESLIYSDKLSVVFFWFLPAIFIILNIAHIAIKATNYVNTPTFYLIAIVAGLVLNLADIGNIFLFSLSDALSLLIYFILGMAYCTYQKRIDSAIKIDNCSVAIGCGLLWLLLYYLEMPLLCAIMGIVMSVGLSKIMANANFGLIKHLDGASYMIFLLSWYPSVAAQQILHHFTDFDWWIYTILSIIVSIYIPWGVFRFIMSYREKSSIVRFLSIITGHSR